MNIFYLDEDVEECAKMHVDKHVVKMILEYSQLLSTAHRVLDGDESTQKSFTGRNVKRYTLSGERESKLYVATHINHPSAVWVRKSAGNYYWLTKLLLELCKEYTYRYGKVHKCERDGLVKMLYERWPDKMPVILFTEPTPAMPDEFIVDGDSIKSYRNYYLGAKTRMFSWKNREVPYWIA